MDETIDIGSALAEQSGMMPEQPQAEMINTEATTPVTTPEVNTNPAPQEIQQQPQFDPTAMNQAMETQSQQIAQIAEQMSQINSNIPQQAPQELSEEAQIQQKIRDDLGITKMEQDAKTQNETIEQQKQMMAQMQQQEMNRQREAEFKNLEAQHGNIDRQAIQNHITNLAKTNPQLAGALNSPEGVAMLVSQGVGAVVKTPDAITPSASGADLATTDASSRVLDGKGTSDDFGALLESYV